MSQISIEQLYQSKNSRIKAEGDFVSSNNRYRAALLLFEGTT